jgi:hypothetical protein
MPAGKPNNRVLNAALGIASPNGGRQLLRVPMPT